MFKKRLRELRIHVGLTQESLGSKLGFEDSTISQYETGKREPDFNTTKKIADYFQVSIDYLLGRTDEKFPWSKTDVFDADGNEIKLSELSENGKRSVIEFYNYIKTKEENEKK